MQCGTGQSSLLIPQSLSAKRYPVLRGRSTLFRLPGIVSTTNVLPIDWRRELED